MQKEQPFRLLHQLHPLNCICLISIINSLFVYNWLINFNQFANIVYIYYTHTHYFNVYVFMFLHFPCRLNLCQADNHIPEDRSLINLWKPVSVATTALLNSESLKSLQLNVSSSYSEMCITDRHSKCSIKLSKSKLLSFNVRIFLGAEYMFSTRYSWVEEMTVFW